MYAAIALDFVHEEASSRYRVAEVLEALPTVLLIHGLNMLGAAEARTLRGYPRVPNSSNLP
jgi:hypothetical protein